MNVINNQFMKRKEIKTMHKNLKSDPRDRCYNQVQDLDWNHQISAHTEKARENILKKICYYPE